MKDAVIITLGDFLLGDLALVLILLGSLPLQYLLAILVNLELGDDALAGINTDMDSGSIHLLSSHSIDVNAELPPVYLQDLALTPLMNHMPCLDLLQKIRKNCPFTFMVPRTTATSSSFRTGIAPTPCYECRYRMDISAIICAWRRALKDLPDTSFGAQR